LPRCSKVIDQDVPGEVLEQHGNRVAPGVGVHFLEVGAVDADTPDLGSYKPAMSLASVVLPRAVLTDRCDDLAGVDTQVDVFDRAAVGVLVAERDAR
jgi:hypothetical protein